MRKPRSKLGPPLSTVEQKQRIVELDLLNKEEFLRGCLCDSGFNTTKHTNERCIMPKKR